MKLRRCARGLLVCATAAIALAGGTGIAHASPNIDPRPQPPGIDDVWSPFPTTWQNPSNEGQPVNDTGDVGMICENLLVRCQ
ncbi:hypothetical protein A5685_03470 [Mycobacterium colombiense]|uniref:Secreted protein n=1 Tax=Mycobacterium colombiense TaxID=339268 RepID=A0A1A2S5W6_9MYCO|nr:hypothetical protein [Mycobacterium colombiense]OBH59564.1 hypothetical protein A5685_03470 [Mycobacterium colombiense]